MINGTDVVGIRDVGFAEIALKYGDIILVPRMGENSPARKVDVAPGVRAVVATRTGKDEFVARIGNKNVVFRMKKFERGGMKLYAVAPAQEWDEVWDDYAVKWAFSILEKYGLPSGVLVLRGPVLRSQGFEFQKGVRSVHVNFPTGFGGVLEIIE